MGVAATTGTQTTPVVDSGWVGLYVITVNYGQTTVTTAQITTYPGAPFLASISGISSYSRGGSTSIALPSANAAAGTVGSSGWSRGPDGKLSQWAYVQLIDEGATSGFTTWTFPVAFASAR